MSDEMKTIEEVAKTTGKAIDLTKSIGGFISKFISGTLEQGMGIFEDKLKYTRWERQVRLMMRAEEFMKSIGMDAPNKPIKLKLAVPLIQAATLEDDDYLQDMWAKLLVNSANDDSKVELTRTYIDILEKLTPFEAKILEKIYSIPFKEMQHNGVITIYLPETVKIYEEEDTQQYKLENEEVTLALANIARLGCIKTMMTWGGGENFSIVNPTILGKYFIDACTI